MPTSPTTPDALRRAQRTLQEAYLIFDAGCALEAVEACRRAATEAPDHHLPPTLEGAFLLAIGRVRPALAVLRRVTRRFPEQPLPRFHFAEACLLAGRRQKGLAELDDAAALDPDSSLAESIRALRELYEGEDGAPSPVPFEVPP